MLHNFTLLKNSIIDLSLPLLHLYTHRILFGGLWLKLISKILHIYWKISIGIETRIRKYDQYFTGYDWYVIYKYERTFLLFQLLLQKCINIRIEILGRTKREEMVIVHGSTMIVKRYVENVCPWRNWYQITLYLMYNMLITMHMLPNIRNLY